MTFRKNLKLYIVEWVYLKYCASIARKTSMEAAIFYSFISLLILICAFKFYRSKTSHKNLPPSPPALPFIGHLHLPKPPMHRTLSTLSQKYGPIFLLRFGSRPVVVISSPSAVAECFGKNDIILANRPKSLVGKYIGYNNSTMTQSSYGDHWRNLRRIGSTEIFSTHRLNMFLSIRQDEIKRLLFKLSSHGSVQDFTKVELRPMFKDLTFNIIVRMISGKRFHGEDVSDEEQAKEFREMISEVTSYLGASNPRDFFPILNWVDGGMFKRKMKRLARKIDGFLQKLVDEHRTRKENLESGNTLIDHLLASQESEPEYYTDEIIKSIMVNLMFAGTDTSAVALEWAMTNLLNHPNTLKTLKEEIDNQIEHQDCLLDEPHLSKLPYLRKIILETLRLYPVTPLLVPHVASQDCIIGGYDVPRDAMVLVNAWAIHRDPTLWDDALSFKPERFDDGEGESFKLLPFGLGRRSCPGAGLANRVIGLTLGSLVQCFEWKRVGEEKVDIKEGRGLTLPKAEPLVAMCRARPVMNKILSQPAHEH
ncbi:cytochrome P450 81Q32-like [Mercurialis annua]|uniref:cytochrome P450 81Q32-like n=1 Tax=Mercurialis annua TaxID=3986 RepID=UPI00215E1313|nr:cytochrome P450 81Q32-like [Mercurialis annua]